MGTIITYITLVIVISGGLYGFYLSKQQIDKNRHESMKIRERMRLANDISTYTPERNYKLEVPVIKKKSEEKTQ